MMDMTNKIAADDARPNTALRYRDIVEAMAEGVVVYNHELSAILCNNSDDVEMRRGEIERGELVTC
jgi:hypothetical protein